MPAAEQRWHGDRAVLGSPEVLQPLLDRTSSPCWPRSLEEAWEALCFCPQSFPQGMTPLLVFCQSRTLTSPLHPLPPCLFHFGDSQSLVGRKSCCKEQLCQDLRCSVVVGFSREGLQVAGRFWKCSDGPIPQLLLPWGSLGMQMLG